MLKGYWPNIMLTSLMCKWGSAKSFDVVSGSTQAPPSQYTFTLDLGLVVSPILESVLAQHGQIINARRILTRGNYGTYFVCVLVTRLSLAHKVYTTK